MTVAIGERFERDDGWIGEIATLTQLGFAFLMARLVNVNDRAPAELVVGSTELRTKWRHCGDAVADIAKRHGFAYHPSVEDAIGDKS